MNLYGFASGDPVNFSDPFGLYAQLNCRPIPSLAGTALHCGIRIVNKKLGINGTFELTRVEDLNRFFMSRDHHMFDPDRWTTIQLPNGMSEDKFDAALMDSYKSEAKRLRGTKYKSGACGNSNHFVQRVIENAGGTVPDGPDKQKGAPAGAPGLRTDCPDTKPQ